MSTRRSTQTSTRRAHSNNADAEIERLREQARRTSHVEEIDDEDDWDDGEEYDPEVEAYFAAEFDELEEEEEVSEPAPASRHGVCLKVVVPAGPSSVCLPSASQLFDDPNSCRLADANGYVAVAGEADPGDLLELLRLHVTRTPGADKGPVRFLFLASNGTQIAEALEVVRMMATVYWRDAERAPVATNPQTQRVAMPPQTTAVESQAAKPTSMAAASAMAGDKKPISKNAAKKLNLVKSGKDETRAVKAATPKKTKTANTKTAKTPQPARRPR